MAHRANVEPITESELGAVSRYLSRNMKSNTSAEKWEQSLRTQWQKNTPNYGYMLKAQGNVTGVFCAFYSEQMINGQKEQFCNPHSWNVTAEYRSQSLDLLLALLRQKNYHFTMYTPNPTVTKVFEAMKFKHLDTRLRIILHFPWPKALAPRYRTLSDVSDIISALPADSAAILRDHKHLQWLRHIAVGDDAGICNIIYKIIRWKRLHVANILYISNVPIYLKCRKSLGSKLLLKHGISMSRIENRFLKDIPFPSFLIDGAMPKLFLSDRLTESNMSNMYSELVGLDL